MGWGGAMRTTPGRRAAAALLGAACVLPAAPPRAAATPERVVVSSKIDTEGALLGNMILLALEALGVPVLDRLQLGPTRIVRAALLAGEVDIYPEYTGNGAFFFGMEDDPAWRDAASAHATAAWLDARANNLVWLPRAPANNTWAIAVRGDVARREELRTMEDFAAAAPRGALKLATSAEFVESPAALPAFERAYGFAMPRRRVVVLPGGETAATLRAAAQNVSGVNASMVYGTDGALAVLDLVVMADTRGAQAVYEPAPVARAAVLERHPAIAPALSRIFSPLSLERLRALNAEIAVEGQPPRRVARRHLLREGVLS
jgi:osmoprotectant transport system substrate-binding protein